MALGRPHSVWRKMARATRSGVGAGSSRVTAESTAAAGPAPPLPLALPAPPHSRGARVGQGRPSRVMTRAAVARGDPLFKENPSGQSRRDSAKYLVAAPKHPPASLKRTWDCLQAMRDDGTWAALNWGQRDYSAGRSERCVESGKTFREHRSIPHHVQERASENDAVRAVEGRDSG